MSHAQSIELSRLAMANTELATLRDETDKVLANLRSLHAELDDNRRMLVERCIGQMGHIRFCAEQAQTYIGMTRERAVPTLDHLRLGDAPMAADYAGD